MEMTDLLITNMFHSSQPGRFRTYIYPFDIPRVMGAIKSLGCNWWKNMHQIDAYPEVHRITARNIRLHLKKYPLQCFGNRS